MVRITTVMAESMKGSLRFALMIVERGKVFAPMVSGESVISLIPAPRLATITMMIVMA